MKKLNYIDLFAGAGGLSEGFIRAGFNPIAHVEMNKDACDTLKTRAAYHWLLENGKKEIYIDYLKSENKTKEKFWEEVPKEIIDSVIHSEISEESLNEIFDKIDNKLGKYKIDLIIGGPPCQAYSVAGRARKNMNEDPRNTLYLYYVEFLKRYQPQMFVFENVPGIFSANNGEHLDNIFKSIRKTGFELNIPLNKYLNAKDFGVLQDRKRVTTSGWRKRGKVPKGAVWNASRKLGVSAEWLITGQGQTVVLAGGMIAEPVSVGQRRGVHLASVSGRRAE